MFFPAQSCVYNNAMYCSRGDIEVGGRNATRMPGYLLRELQGAPRQHLPAIRWERRLPMRTSAVRQSTASTIRTAVAAPAMWMFQARRPVAVRRQSARHLQSDRIAKQSVYHRIKRTPVELRALPGYGFTGRKGLFHIKMESSRMKKKEKKRKNK